MTSGSLPRRAAILAACLGATAAVGASPALAATTFIPGANVPASGSSLQNPAQNGSPSSAYPGLTSLWHANPNTDQKFLDSPFTYELSNDPSVTYTSTSSGKGLAEFGNTGAGLTTADDPNSSGELDGFIGTDDPPTQTNLQDANTASGGVDEVTVPVFQAPVALLLSLPANLTIGTNGVVKLTNTLTQEIYDNTVPGSGTYSGNTWGALLLDSGLKLTTGTPTATQFKDSGGGTASIVREVRNGGSGTTYATQGFLNISGDATYAGYSDSEALWPTADTTDGCPVGGNGTTTCPTSGDPYENGDNAAATGNTGSSQLVKNTIADPGTIGYANEADAVLDAGSPYANTKVTTTTYDGSASHQIVLAEVQNNYDGTQTGSGSNTPAYAAPGTIAASGGKETITANAFDGSGVNTSGTYVITNGASDKVGDWNYDTSGSFGNSYGGSLAGDPNVKDHGGLASNYPIIAATYDVAWADYDSAGLEGSPAGYASSANAEEIANSVVDYLAFETNGGQTSISTAKIGYQKLPTDIDTLAKAAAISIPVYTNPS